MCSSDLNLLLAGKWWVPSTRACNVLKMFSLVSRPPHPSGKGLESEFQVLWKAGDKMWVPYCEVAHLNILDRYCELMGVKNVFKLSSNYVYEDSEEEDDNNIIQAQMCEV